MDVDVIDVVSAVSRMNNEGDMGYAIDLFTLRLLFLQN